MCAPMTRKAMDQARRIMPDVTFCDDPYDCVTGAEALAIVTEWDEFRALDLGRIKSLMAAANLIDLRNIYRPADARKHGFAYSSVGRP